MKFNNEELADIADDARTNIKFALDTLNSAEEYKDVFDILEEAMNMLNEVAEPYEKAYKRDLKLERDFENSEYMRSVI